MIEDVMLGFALETVFRETEKCSCEVEGDRGKLANAHVILAGLAAAPQSPRGQCHSVSRVCVVHD